MAADDGWVGGGWRAGVGGLRKPQWPIIEKEKGRYEVDPVLDDCFTDLRRCRGPRLGLDITGSQPTLQESATGDELARGRAGALQAHGVG